MAQTQTRPRAFKSIQIRYLWGTVFVCLIILLITGGVQYYLTQLDNAVNKQIIQQYQLYAYYQQAGKALQESEALLYQQMLYPDSDTIIAWKHQVQAVKKNLQSASKTTWVTNYELLPYFKSLLETHTILMEKGKALFLLRNNAQMQYPALEILTKEMLPEYDHIMQQLEALLHDKDQGGYKKLLLLRKNWQTLLDVFRIYMVDNLGIISESKRLLSEKKISQLYQENINYIKVLKKDKLIFEQKAQLDKVQKNIQKWYDYFIEIKMLHTMKQWRKDLQFLKQAVIPLYVQMWERLDVVDKQLKKTEKDYVAMSHEMINILAHILWGIAFIGIALIGFAYIYILRWILIPMAQVSQALRAEAYGENFVGLPDSNTEEIHQLIKAFKEMQNKMRLRESAIEHMSMHDELTGLPNRNTLQERLREAIYQCGENEVSIILMDLDRFKEINDTLGHYAGDVLLQKVGERISELLGQKYVIARIGGDEFAVLVENLEVEKNREGILQLANQLLELFDKPFSLREHRLYVGISMGIAIYPEHGDNSHTLIKQADVAMYLAKSKGGGIAFYDPAKDVNRIDRLGLLGELKEAINNEGLAVFFQPKIDITTKTLIGVECLVRWYHPIWGDLDPEEFIPLAEKSGLMNALTFWVIEASLAVVAKWRQMGCHLKISVNISAENLRDPQLISELRERLPKWNIPPESLVLEITESAVVSDPRYAKNVLTEIAKMGISLSVDDFGTGFSSLSYLKDYPVKELKIDKSFVLNMAEDENDAVIVASTIEMAHNLGLSVVAEGVETEEVLNILKRFQCDVAQGYFISRPLSAKRFLQWREQSPWLIKPTPSV